MTRKQESNSSSKTFDYGFKTKAEELAVSIREEMGLSKYDPLNAFDLAQHKRIQVYSFEEILRDKIHKAKLDLLNNSNHVSALYLKNCEGQPIILHKTSVDASRQQSNMMHEIAHILLGHEIPKDLLQLANRLGLLYDNTKQENEAKFLGGCLQLTKPSLLFCLKRNFTVENIAEKYNASIEMVNYRINISGVKHIHSRKYGQS